MKRIHDNFLNKVREKLNDIRCYQNLLNKIVEECPGCKKVIKKYLDKELHKDWTNFSNLDLQDPDGSYIHLKSLFEVDESDKTE